MISPEELKQVKDNLVKLDMTRAVSTETNQFKYAVKFPLIEPLAKIFKVKENYFKQKLSIDRFTASFENDQLFVIITNGNVPGRINLRIKQRLEQLEVETKACFFFENNEKTGVEIIFNSDLEKKSRKDFFSSVVVLKGEPWFCEVRKVSGKIRIWRTWDTPDNLQVQNLLDAISALLQKKFPKKTPEFIDLSVEEKDPEVNKTSSQSVIDLTAEEKGTQVNESPAQSTVYEPVSPQNLQVLSESASNCEVVSIEKKEDIISRFFSNQFSFSQPENSGEKLTENYDEKKKLRIVIQNHKVLRYEIIPVNFWNEQNKGNSQKRKYEEVENNKSETQHEEVKNNESETQYEEMNKNEMDDTENEIINPFDPDFN